MGCCQWFCAELCAIFSSSAILVLDFADVSIGAVLLYYAVLPPSWTQGRTWSAIGVYTPLASASVHTVEL